MVFACLCQRTMDFCKTQTLLDPHMKGSDPNPLEGSGPSPIPMVWFGTVKTAVFTEHLGTTQKKTRSTRLFGLESRPIKPCPCSLDSSVVSDDREA